MGHLDHWFPNGVPWSKSRYAVGFCDSYTLDLILEHFLKCLLKYLLMNFEKKQPKKTSPPDSWSPGNVLNRQSCALILKLNMRSRAPAFSYRNAPPAPYKGMQLKRRVHNPQTLQQRKINFRLIKIMSKRKASTGGLNADLTSPVQRWN